MTVSLNSVRGEMSLHVNSAERNCAHRTLSSSLKRRGNELFFISVLSRLYIYVPTPPPLSVIYVRLDLICQSKLTMSLNIGS